MEQEATANTRNGIKGFFDAARAEVIRRPIEYLSVVSALIICLLLFDYVDCISYTVWSIDIWESLFNGRITEYFTVSAENKWGAPHGGNCYGVLWLVPWAIWNLPIWVIQTVNGTYTVDEPVFMIWSKLFLVLCTALIGIYSKKIVMKLTNDEHLASLGLLLSIAGGTALISVGFSGQDEVMYMASFLMGAYYLMMNKRVLGAILIVFSIVCFPLMILPLAVVLMVKERNLIKIIAMMVISLIPDKIVSRICGISAIPELREMYPIAEEFPLARIIDWYFLSTSIGVGKSILSILALILTLVLLYCYIRKHQDDNRAILLGITISFLSIYMFSWMHFYRFYSCMLPATIAVLVLLKENESAQKVALFLMCLLEYTAMIVACFDPNCMAYYAVNGSALGGLADWGYEGNFITIMILRYGVVYTGFEPLLISASIGISMMLLWFLIKKPVMEWKFDLDLDKSALIYALSPLVLLTLVFVMPVVF